MVSAVEGRTFSFSSKAYLTSAICLRKSNCYVSDDEFLDIHRFRTCINCYVSAAMITIVSYNLCCYVPKCMFIYLSCTDFGKAT